MKNILSIALCATAIAAFGDDIVVSETQVGIYPVQSSTKNTLIAVSLHSDGGQAISVSNLVKTANLTKGDKLYAFDSATGLYEGWELDENKRWKSATTKYYIDASGDIAMKEGTSAGGATQIVGTGIWLVRASDTPGSFTIYLTGKPVTSPTTTIVAGKTNLVGNPTKVAGTPEISGAANGDVIEVPGGSGPTGRTRYQYNGTKSEWTTIKDHAVSKGLPVIPANQGFWYLSKGASNITIETWTPVK